MIRALLLTLVLCTPAWAQRKLEPTVWDVDGQKRQALVIAPAKTIQQAAPVVFVFHGHGGNMTNSSKLGFQQHWPEAYIVCPQGLPTETARDPEGKRSGWQPRIGVNDDRDLKFFDAMLKTLEEKHSVDTNRVYVTGHSNGGGFTYTLWAARGTKLAAVAPSAAGSASLKIVGDRPTIPVMHVAGKSDQVVPFEAQERTIEAVREFNQCIKQGKAYAKQGDLEATVYDSPKEAPVVTVIHPGGHKYPQQAPELMVKFFKEHQRKKSDKVTDQKPQ